MSEDHRWLAGLLLFCVYPDGRHHCHNERYGASCRVAITRAFEKIQRKNRADLVVCFRSLNYPVQENP